MIIRLHVHVVQSLHTYYRNCCNYHPPLGVLCMSPLCYAMPSAGHASTVLLTVLREILENAKCSCKSFFVQNNNVVRVVDAIGNYDNAAFSNCL